MVHGIKQLSTTTLLIQKKNKPYLIKVKSFWKKVENPKTIKAETDKIENLKKLRK